jgi:phosphoribosylanthranilate isomerase
MIIQIAGIKDLAEAELVLGCGVLWLGFPLRLPVNAADTSEEEAAAIIAALPALAIPVLITYETTATAILDFCRQLEVRHVQLHGPVPPAETQKLRALDSKLFIIKSLVVRNDNLDELLELARAHAPHIDAFITDTHDPRTGADGATGRTHDWRISRALVEANLRPVILAGGLTPDNVRAAIQAVRPAGIDAHTGVEGPDGRKDPDKLRRFVRETLAASKA